MIFYDILDSKQREFLNRIPSAIGTPCFAGMM